MRKIEKLFLKLISNLIKTNIDFNLPEALAKLNMFVCFLIATICICKMPNLVVLMCSPKARYSKEAQRSPAVMQVSQPGTPQIKSAS